eukprot:gene1337-382_t
MVNPVTRPRGHFADSDTTDGDNSRRSRPQRLSRLSLSDESCYNPRFFQSAQAPNCVKGGRRNTGHRLSSSAGLSEAAYSTTAPSQCSGDFLDEAQYNPFYNRNRADIDTKKMTPCEWPLPSVGKKQLGLSRTNGNRALTHGIPTTTNRSSISFRRMWEHFRGLWRQSACFRVVVVSSFFALAVIIVITVLSATGTFSNNGQIPSNRQSANAANNLAMHDYGIRFQLEDPPAASFVQISDSTSFVQADDSETNIKPEYQTATWKMISTFKDPTTIIFDEPSDPRVSIHPQEITVQPADRKSLRVETVCSKETVGNCESGLVYAWRFLAGGQILIEGGSIGEKSFSPFEVQLNGAHHTFSVPKYKQLVDPVHLSESDFSKLESLLKTPETGVEFRFEGNGEILHLPVGWRFKDPTPTKVGEEPKMIEGNPICLNAYRGSVLVMAEDGGEGLPVLPSVIDGKIEVKVSSNANQQQRLFVSFFDGQVQPQPQWAASEGTTPPGETKPIDAIAQEFLVLPNQQEVLSIEVPRKCRRSRGTDCTFTISAHQPTELFSNGDERQIAVESSVKVMHSGGKFFVREIETPGFKDKPTMTKFEDWVTMPADEKQAAIDVDQRERQQQGLLVELDRSRHPLVVRGRNHHHRRPVVRIQPLMQLRTTRRPRKPKRSGCGYFERLLRNKNATLPPAQSRRQGAPVCFESKLCKKRIACVVNDVVKTPLQKCKRLFARKVLLNKYIVFARIAFVRTQSSPQGKCLTMQRQQIVCTSPVGPPPLAPFNGPRGGNRLVPMPLPNFKRLLDGHRLCRNCIVFVMNDVAKLPLQKCKRLGVANMLLTK